MTQENANSTADINYLEYLAVPVCAVDANGKLCFWNAQMAELTGHPAESVLGKRAWAGLLAQRGSTPLDEALSSGDAKGRAFLDRIHELTGAQVAASTNATGAASLGGDWNLEFSTGPINTTVAPSLAEQQA